MTDFFRLIVDKLFIPIFDKFNMTFFELGGYNVSLGSVIFVMIAIYMVVSIYWRGAKG